MTARVQVPVPAETGGEDRLAGSLTFRHAAYLAVAAAGLAVMLLSERSVGRVVAGAVLAVVGVTGAAVRPYGEPLDRLAPAAVAFLRRRRADCRPDTVGDAAEESEPALASPPPVEPEKPRWRRPRMPVLPVRQVAVPAALLAIAVVALLRWPAPATPPPPQVVVVPVPAPAPDPWEEADDAMDAWLHDLFAD